MQKQVHVRVDQAGQQSGIAEIDHRGALRMLHRRSHGLNPLALDQNLAGPQHVSGIYFKQPRRVEHDGRVGRLAHGLLRWGCFAKDEDCENGEKAAANWKVEHGYEYRAFSIHLLTSPVPCEG